MIAGSGLLRKQILVCPKIHLCLDPDQSVASSAGNTNYMKALLLMFPDSEEEAKEIEILEVCPSCLHTKIKRPDGKIQWVMPVYIKPIAGDKERKP